MSSSRLFIGRPPTGFGATARASGITRPSQACSASRSWSSGNQISSGTKTQALRMPLRAKILTPHVAVNGNVGIAENRTMSTNVEVAGTNTEESAKTSTLKFPVTRASQEDIPVSEEDLENIRELPGDAPEDVYFQSLYGLRTIELNNPAKLNSLDASMIRKIAPRLREWSRSELANVVVIKGAGNRAFCAGGDVMSLAKWNQEGRRGVKKSADFFALEYALDHYIATYDKPYVAFMDGITMGGGVGLSLHAPFRIATENTVFAMPETGIGFFPDVGGTFFLNRLPGFLGTYLGLTGDQVRGANCFYTGIATHYLPSAQLPALERRLAELRFHDYDSYETRCGLVDQTINEFSLGMPWDQSFEWGGWKRDMIDKAFCYDDISRILKSLEKVERVSEAQVWADKTRESLLKRCPTSLVMSLAQLRAGEDWSIAKVFEREHDLAARFMANANFAEGVLAQLQKPRRQAIWEPASIDDINNKVKYVRDFLSKTPPNLPNNLLKFKPWADKSFEEYPLNFGVPTEEDVLEVFEEMDGQQITRTGLVRGTLERRSGGLQHPGFATVVADIVDRCTQSVPAKKTLEWIVGSDDVPHRTFGNAKRRKRINRLRAQREEKIAAKRKVLKDERRADDEKFRVEKAKKRKWAEARDAARQMRDQKIAADVAAAEAEAETLQGQVPVEGQEEPKAEAEAEQPNTRESTGEAKDGSLDKQ